jgi:hypothetical protein
LKSAYRKISRVRSVTGGTAWYLSEDCLLAAKRVMYAVEYRRFYLHDLESIVVWPSRLWLWRLILPAALLAILGASLWRWANSIAGGIFVGLALSWTLWELALGPTAKACIRTTGARIDLPLVSRARRAEKVLSRIDEALRATRTATEQPPASATISSPMEPQIQTISEAAAIASVAPATYTNGAR